MSVTLKFVKGFFLSTHDQWTTDPTIPNHAIQLDRLLRIKSKTKPPTPPKPEFDLQWDALSPVKIVWIKAPAVSGILPPCKNDNPSLGFIAPDIPLNNPARLLSINVWGGSFSYPHGWVGLPRDPYRSKAFGWLQVDFELGPVTVELFSAPGVSLGSYKVDDGQAFDVAGYIMYKHENGAIDEEPMAAAAAGSGTFKVLEQSDGGGQPPN
ncbi:MAG: hypothetical protein HYR55_13390 [Acidobacteria bacterium]|nr:hypothetical protein [Acidobacteriota bacterium]